MVIGIGVGRSTCVFVYVQIRDSTRRQVINEGNHKYTAKVEGILHMFKGCFSPSQLFDI